MEFFRSYKRNPAGMLSANVGPRNFKVRPSFFFLQINKPFFSRAWTPLFSFEPKARTLEKLRALLLVLFSRYCRSISKLPGEKIITHYLIQILIQFFRIIDWPDFSIFGLRATWVLTFQTLTYVIPLAGLISDRGTLKQPTSPTPSDRSIPFFNFPTHSFPASPPFPTWSFSQTVLSLPT